jgi:toxin FitB
MGTTWLLDTNPVIYYLDAALPEKALDLMEKNLDETGSNISIISKIELLGWQAPTAEAMQQVENFVRDSTIIPLTDAIADKAIELKRIQKIKLPDAVIAATALEYGYTLISRNDVDFRKIPGLKYLNPFTDI